LFSNAIVVLSCFDFDFLKESDFTKKKIQKTTAIKINIYGN